MPNSMSQNIFDYATSELSQDAFISLLVAWFNSEDKRKVQISIDFINALYRAHSAVSSTLDIESVNLKRKHHKIDVHFVVREKNGNTIPFIIEDKTWTEPHSNQLSRYTKAIMQEHTKKHEEIVKIFFKTGHITEKDLAETSASGYTIVDVQWFYDFLKRHKTNSEIYNTYFVFLKKNFYDKLYNQNRHKKTLNDWTVDDLRKGYVQYAFIEKIKKLTLGPDASGQSYIKFTRNGTRWDTWWTFYRANDFSVFVKIKYLKGGHRLRLVEYSQKDFSPTDKKTTLNRHIEIVEKIAKANCAIQKTRKPRYAARESEIAYFPLQTAENLDTSLAMEEIAETIANFLKSFISELQVSNAMLFNTKGQYDAQN
jgi:hypothetical protein